jgi:hypothetical protein
VYSVAGEHEPLDTAARTIPVVELRFATLPGVLGLLAVHHWFVVWDADGCHRWEVWQTRNAGGRSIGHVHCDLKAPDAGVGGGPARVAARWSGSEAAALRDALRDAAAYPHCERYVAWPGPNSNTFVAWVLRRARVVHRLGRRALGGSYRVS